MDPYYVLTYRYHPSWQIPGLIMFHCCTEYIVPKPTSFGDVGYFDCLEEFGLADAGFGHCFTNFSNGPLLLASESVAIWLESRGTKAEQVSAAIIIHISSTTSSLGVTCILWQCLMTNSSRYLMCRKVHLSVSGLHVSVKFRCQGVRNCQVLDYSR